MSGGMTAAALLAGAAAWLWVAWAERVAEERRWVSAVRGRASVRPWDRILQVRGPRRRPEPLEPLLMGLAAQLRAGAPLPQALRQVAQDAGAEGRPELAMAVALAERGEWAGAVALLAGPTPGATLDRLRAATEVARRAGGNLAPVMELLAEAERADTLRRLELRARTAEARWSAWILAVSPLLMVVYVAMVYPRLLAGLWGSGLGLAATVYAVASWLAGVALIRALLARAARTAG